MPDPRFPDPKLPENKATDIPPGPTRVSEPVKPAVTTAPAPASAPIPAKPNVAVTLAPAAATAPTPPKEEKHYRTLGHVGAHAPGSVVPRSAWGPDADFKRLIDLGAIVEDVPERPK